MGKGREANDRPWLYWSGLSSFKRDWVRSVSTGQEGREDGWREKWEGGGGDTETETQRETKKE